MTDRFYPQEKPEVNNYVMVQITSITDLECQAYIPEYDLEGCIPLTHVFQKKGRKKRFTVQPGDLKCVEVVNPNSVPVELSAKGLDETEVEKASNRYYTVNRLYRFFKYWSGQSNIDLVQKILWEYHNRYEKLFEEKEYWKGQVPTKVATEFEKLCRKTTERFTIDFELVCHEQYAVGNIQKVIDHGMKDNADIVCLYTGRKGEEGSVYTLSTVAETDLSLLEVVEKMKGICEEHCVTLTRM